jgi:hypothetical protein
MTTSNDAVKCADTANYSCIDYEAWYFNSSPGPAVPCDAHANALPSTVFDGDSVRNNSIPASFNLTPATPYTCKTPAGELSWTPYSPADPVKGDGELTIRGTVFIDGSAYVNNPSNKVYTYQGVGSIMLSGSFGMKGAKLCARLTSNGKDCDLLGANPPAWDPNPPNGDALAIIADGSGYAAGPTPANVASPYGAEVTTAQFQGIVAATNGVNMNTSTQVQGPIMSVDAAVLPSQSLNLTFPPIPFAPSSAPGQPPPPAQLLAPRDFAGG